MRRVHFAVTDSTNSQARSLAAQHPGECILVTADEQTAGRGRQGRRWHSPRGGAWMSLAWPMRHAPAAYGTASLVAAVAVLRGVSDAAPECAARLQIKWPNDLLISGRKVAGILCEQTLAAGAGRAGTLLIGVGVNVDFDGALLASDLRHPAATLRQESTGPVAVEHVVDAVAAHLTQLLDEFEAEGFSEAIAQTIQRRLAYVGAVRSIELAGRVATGRIAGIDAHGRLMIQAADGETVYASGELLYQDGDGVGSL